MTSRRRKHRMVAAPGRIAGRNHRHQPATPRHSPTTPHPRRRSQDRRVPPFSGSLDARDTLVWMMHCQRSVNDSPLFTSRNRPHSPGTVRFLVRREEITSGRVGRAGCRLIGHPGGAERIPQFGPHTAGTGRAGGSVLEKTDEERPEAPPDPILAGAGLRLGLSLCVLAVVGQLDGDDLAGRITYVTCPATALACQPPVSCRP